MAPQDSDPLLANASEDLDALAEKLGQELHEQRDHVDVKTKVLELAARYGWSLVEAAIRVSLRLAGVPVPPALPSS